MPRSGLTFQEFQQALRQATGSDEKVPGYNTESEHGTLQATTSLNSTQLQDALHEFSQFPRPTKAEELQDLSKLLSKLIEMCGSDPNNWKIFVLTTFCRRYHSKAPQARLESDADPVGDGERLIFYFTMLMLHRHNSKFSTKALSILIELMSCMGSTRDLCAMIEHLLLSNLLDSKQVTLRDALPESFKEKLVSILQNLLSSEKDLSLQLAIGLAAQQLDQDFAEIQSDGLISTMHIFLPHNKRGTKSDGMWHRSLVNSLAEILIWQNSKVTQRDNRFSQALSAFLQTPMKSTSVSSKHACILEMQTTIRKKRKVLNQCSRERGFMLCSAYMMDKESVSFKQIRKGKAGDLHNLQRLARKRADSRVLQMLLKRNLDPSKATVAGSIQEIVSNWIDVTATKDELTEVELQIQAATIEATIERLRPTTTDERPVIVTQIGTDVQNTVCAVLVAAALKGARLLLNSEEHDVSTTESSINLINRVIAGDLSLAIDEQKTIKEILTEKISDSADLVVLSSCDLQLDENVLQDMQARDITIRVHSTAKVETTEAVSLSINDQLRGRLKAGAKLSLAVLLDCTGSMGSEIEGCKQGAMTLISSFNDLAPVQCVNFMGYWDPVNVRSDPLPKSTGYLAPKNNIDRIQKFVDTELKCQGGGDEPEDIPRALEKLLEDIKKKGLSAEEGVHLVFFIADAGFRPNENARMQTALSALRELNVIMVMCKVRGGSSLSRLVDRQRDCFQDAGQYIELDGVGQLESIAASVTESIRASLFMSANVVSVTSSVGQTVDAIAQLVAFQNDHSVLKKTEELAAMPVVEDADDEAAESEEEGVVELEEEETEVLESLPEGVLEKKEVFAKTNAFKLTNKDRLYLQLSRLPKVCREKVDAVFGGKTLQEITAVSIAEQLRADNVPIGEVRKAGFPRDVLDLVQAMIGAHGMQPISAR